MFVSTALYCPPAMEYSLVSRVLILSVVSTKRDSKAMDNILGCQSNNNGLVHGERKLVNRRDIVFSRGIGAVKPERILRRYKLHIPFSEHAISARVMDVPGELL